MLQFVLAKLNTLFYFLYYIFSICYSTHFYTYFCDRLQVWKRTIEIKRRFFTESRIVRSKPIRSHGLNTHLQDGGVLLSKSLFNAFYMGIIPKNDKGFGQTINNPC